MSKHILLEEALIELRLLTNEYHQHMNDKDLLRALKLIQRLEGEV